MSTKAALQLDEVWKVIPGFEYYEASNLGRIRRSSGTPKCRTARILRPGTQKTGYLFLILSMDSTAKTQRVHRLVMRAFVGPSDLEVNHKNGIKADNRLVNLEYVTSSQNKIHSMKMGMMYIPSAGQGEDHPNSKLTEAQVLDIRKAPGTHRNIAKQYGVSKTTVSFIKLKKSWSWL